MHDVEFSEDGGGVRGQDHFLQVIDDDLVEAVRAERGPHRRGDGEAGLDVTNYGAVFGFVAGGRLLLETGGVLGGGEGYFE